MKKKQVLVLGYKEVNFDPIKKVREKQSLQPSFLNSDQIIVIVKIFGIFRRLIIKLQFFLIGLFNISSFSDKFKYFKH